MPEFCRKKSKKQEKTNILGSVHYLGMTVWMLILAGGDRTHKYPAEPGLDLVATQDGSRLFGCM